MQTKNDAVCRLFETVWKYTGLLVTARVIQAHSLAAQGLPLLVPLVSAPSASWTFSTPIQFEDYVLGAALANREMMFPVHFLSMFDRQRYSHIDNLLDGFRGAFMSFSRNRWMVRHGPHPYNFAPYPPAASILKTACVIPFTSPPPTVFWFFPPTPALVRYVTLAGVPVDCDHVPFDDDRQ